jgi:mono/diheme cytochrome c family protein
MIKRTAPVIAGTAIIIAASLGVALGARLSAAHPQRSQASGTSRAADHNPLEHGSYLVAIGSCNDCHTPGYNERGGDMPVEDWLTGSSVGFSGPWGTSYPPNLRLTVQSMTEEEWLTFARARRLPPMPWFSVAPMSDQDLRDIYRFIRALGPKGERAPAPLPPGERGSTPSILFVPQ